MPASARGKEIGIDETAIDKEKAREKGERTMCVNVCEREREGSKRDGKRGGSEWEKHG